MEQLITLKLHPTSDYSSSSPFLPTRSSGRYHKRKTSIPVPLTLYPNNPPKSSSSNRTEVSNKPAVPARNPRRVSSMPKLGLLSQMQATPAPSSKEYWDSAVKDIRTLYSERHYELCADRCIDILENRRGPIHHIHSLFFSFYAATCLELHALQLEVKSEARIPLLNCAKAYYEIAASYITHAEAEYSILSLPSQSPSHNRSLSSSSSDSSNSDSSTDSQTYHTPLPSPASSICDFYDAKRDLPKTHTEEDDPLKPRPLTVKKKVSFQSTHPTVISDGHKKAASDVNPPKRPFSAQPASHNSTQRRVTVSPWNLEFPQGPPPTTPLPAIPKAPAPTVPLPAIPLKSQRRSQYLSSSTSLPLPESVQSKAIEKQTILRYQSQLLSLRPQTSYHLTQISKMIHDITTASSNAIETESPFTSHSSSANSYPWNRRNGREFSKSDIHLDYYSDDLSSSEDSENFSGGASSSSYEDGDGSERRQLPRDYKGLLEKIEEGRSRMWVRRRFDGSRYQRLRERVQSELQHKWTEYLFRRYGRIE